MVFHNLDKYCENYLVSKGKTPTEAAQLVADNLSALHTEAHNCYKQNCDDLLAESTTPTYTPTDVLTLPNRHEVRTRLVSDLHAWMDTNLLP